MKQENSPDAFVPSNILKLYLLGIIPSSCCDGSIAVDVDATATATATAAATLLLREFYMLCTKTMGWWVGRGAGM